MTTESHVEREIAAITDILSALKIKKGWLVEVGAADGIWWSNTIGLIREGWKAVLIEADPERFSELYKNMIEHLLVQPFHMRVGREDDNNLDRILHDTQTPEDFDLLQIDIDGNDYWIWEGLSYRPKVVSIEYNSNFEPYERKAVKYERDLIWTGDTYYGASAGALAALGEKKGYVLVYHAPQTNLFFVRRDLSAGFTPLDVNSIKKQPIHRPTDKVFTEIL